MFKKATLQVLGLTAALAAGGAMIGFAGGPEHDHHVAKVGEKAPDFSLVDLDGKKHTLSDYTADGQTVVLEWFNPSCPFVQKHYAYEHQTMNETIKEFKNEKVVWLRVNSGSERSGTSGVEKNKAAAEEWKIATPILLDLEGEVGQSYGAKRTPEMYVIDSEGVLRYHGAIDSDSRPRDIGEEIYVKTALQEVLAGETVTTSETKAYGCSIKYKR